MALGKETRNAKARTSGIPSSEYLGKNLSIIIPAFNEDAGITETLHTLMAALPEAEIIVVDDGSTDGTAKNVLQFNNVRLFRNRFNSGYGASLKVGMLAASNSLVAWFDADNEHRAEDLRDMVVRLEQSNLAAVIGERQTRGSTRLRVWGKFIISLLVRALKSKPIRDLNCGLRVFRRDIILRYLQVLPDGFSASLTSTMVLLELGYPLEFHPISLNSRIGNSKVVLADGFAVLALVLRIIMLVAPMRIFLRGGAALLLLSFVYGSSAVLFFGTRFPIISMLLSVVGVVLCVLALIADQISQMRLNTLETSIVGRGLSWEEKRPEAVDESSPAVG